MTPDDPRHGTEAGNEQHRRDGEEPCPPCARADILAARRRSKRKTMGHLYTRPLGQDIVDRLTALRAKGATHDDIAKWAGISTSQAWRCCQIGPEGVVYARTWERLTAMKSGRIVTPIGITRRIQALSWLGYSPRAIADAAGVNFDTVRDARKAPREFMAERVRESIADTYERLCMTPPTPTNQQEKAGVSRVQSLARRNGWAPPLSWEDIDDPTTQPDGVPRRRRVIAKDSKIGNEFDYDEAVVLRVLSGEILPTKRADKLEIMRRHLAAGGSERSLCIRMSWKEGRYSDSRVGGPAHANSAEKEAC